MRKLPVTPTKTETILGLVYLGLELLVLPSALVLLNMLLPQPLSEARLNLVFFVLNFFTVGLILRRFIGRSLAATQPVLLPGTALRGLLIHWSAGYLVGLLILLVDPDFANVNDAFIDTMVEQDVLFSILGTVILVPPCEELLFRGVIFGGLYNRSRTAAYVISAMAFSAIHVVGYIGYFDWLTLVLCFAQYLPAGIALGWAYARSGSILAPIIMHTVINALGVALMR